jgi:hypothetical protein
VVVGEAAPGNGFGTGAVLLPADPLVAQATPAVDAIANSKSTCRTIVTTL